ncbi:hypothetical protein HQ520_12290 [bacterium]|nr:hypothetical protein [bacterium]
MRKISCLFLLALSILASPVALGDDLAAGFQNPPDSARPHVWWHWMNGNVTREGITADLEAMKRVGIGGAQIFNVNQGIPAGPIVYMSPEWREMTLYAAKEANRLGLELCIHNCSGWSSSGGPWITPDHAMQKVVMSETKVVGPRELDMALPQPPANLDFYRDIAVLAFPPPGGEAVDIQSYAPRLTSFAGPVDAARLMDNQTDTFVTLPLPEKGKPQYLQFEFDKPFLTRLVTIVPMPGTNHIDGAIQISDDGRTFRTIRLFNFPRLESRTLIMSLDPEVCARFYRITFDHAGDKARCLAIADIELCPRLSIDNLRVKAAFDTGEVGAPTWGPPAPEMSVPHRKILDLTAAMTPDGHLTWDVPDGEWVVQRFGYTPTGRKNHPAAEGGLGLECDKLSRTGLDQHWTQGQMQVLIDTLGPLVGNTLNNVLIDSYEVGAQNWTAAFRKEFRKRRGYDLLPYLPTLGGRVVDSPEIAERFLWDFRRTIADLFADNYFGYFVELCHDKGMQASIEPYSGPFEGMQSGALADIPMGEFWVGSSGVGDSTRLAASLGHTYGHRVIGAESFTAIPDLGRWQNDPWSLKAVGDAVYCGGVNRFVVHRYAMQPWQDQFPGMTMGQWGTHFERTNTWWEQSRAWVEYCTRCQYLLQSGQFNADVAYFLGEDAPRTFPSGQFKPSLPAGYGYDGIGADILMNHTRVQNGRLVLDSGMTYRVLVLPTSAMMTPVLLAKIKDLVETGAVVVGPKTTGSPSLEDYPRCDERVRQLADALWGPGEQPVIERSVGRGEVIAGKSLEEIFDEMGVQPDFETIKPKNTPVVFIHRMIDDAEVYFIANHGTGFTDVQCAFRVVGRLPELWHPDTGHMEAAPFYEEKDGRTFVNLRLDPAGSVFVVFREKAADVLHAVDVRQVDATSKQPTQNLLVTQAIYEAQDGAGSLDITARVAALFAEGAQVIQVNNELAGKDPTPMHVKQLHVEYTLDGKPGTVTIRENGMLELPPKESAHWGQFPPFELEATQPDRLQLTAWQDGAFAVETNTGKEVRLTAHDVPEPLEVGGPWWVAFPPNWGAPARVTLEELISWTDHPDTGVKYFSGTATYTKELQIPAEWLASDMTLALYLGRVKNLAEVHLNGHDLGILWKPPFRVDLTGVARTGANTLEVKITNLWCNRLIGDEQFPQDCEWNGKSLKEWPAWLVKGEPRTSGRFTFTTWHHFEKDSPLYESGLVGPVVLRAARRVATELPR